MKTTPLLIVCVIALLGETPLVAQQLVSSGTARPHGLAGPAIINADFGRRPVKGVLVHEYWSR
jgi:hypothetical protein